MPAWLTITLIGLATFRLTRLVTIDAFPPVAAVRERIGRRWGDTSWQAYLAECPWCVSVYVAAIVTAATAAVVDVPAPWLVWPTASALTGIIAEYTTPDTL